MVRRLASLAAALAAMTTAVASLSEPPAALPGPAPRFHGPQVHVLNEACIRCHTDVAAEWSGSLHANAFTDDAFQRAYQREPLPFCRKCHAPESDPRSPPTAFAASAGVTCVTCHVLGGRIVTGGDRPVRGVPHDLVRRPSFASPQACAACHDFAFPDDEGTMMQKTFTEHQAGTASSTPCIDCHMPTPTAESALGRRRRSHRFAASRDPSMLRKAVVITAERRGEVAHINLSPGEIGHGFPTGDPWRRVTVHLEVVGDLRPEPRRIVRELGRFFRPVALRDGGLGFAETADFRINVPAGRAIDIRENLGEGAAGRPIAYRVDFERGEPGVEAAAASIVTLGAGELAPPAPAPAAGR